MKQGRFTPAALANCWLGLFRARNRRRERGASLVEYALLVALIAIVCVAAVAYFGSATSDKFSDVGSEVTNV